MFKAFAVAALVFCNSVANAGLFRIGYPGTPVTGVDYAYNNIAAAMTAASAGDTIQLYQLYWPASTNITVTKSLKFVGYGYMLNHNTGLQAVTGGDNNTIAFNFSTGAAGSVVTGVNCGQVQISTSNVAIRRCRIPSGLLLTGPISNIEVSQCFISGYMQEYIGQNITNLSITNSVLNGISLPTSTGLFANNVVSFYNGGATISGFVVRNSVFGGCPTSSSGTFQNNLFSGNCTGSITGTANQFNVNLSNVFTNWNNGNPVVDTQFVLKPASPALNAGLRFDSTVTDAGIFGGEIGGVYRLSGIPPIPSIYQLSTPSQAATTNPYTITISVRSNN